MPSYPKATASNDDLRKPDRPGQGCETGFEVQDAALDESILSQVIKAMLSRNAERADAIMDDLRRHLVSQKDLIDLYIPAAARHFGARWCEDSMSFAEVTIGCARLQSWLREIDQDIVRPRADDMDLPSILLVVPPGVYHTLGAMTALSQFRRLGATVRLEIGATAEAVVATARLHRFDMVAISASASERLEMLRILVEKLRSGLDAVPPIVIGGSLLDTEPEADTLVGADHATTSPAEALDLCGLKAVDLVLMTDARRPA